MTISRPTQPEVVNAYEAIMGRRLKVVGSELCGPCPVCGGEDRFHVTASAVVGCRGCQPGGDNPAAYKAIMVALGFGIEEGEPQSYGRGPDPGPDPGPEPDPVYGCTVAHFYDKSGLKPHSYHGLKDTYYRFPSNHARAGQEIPAVGFPHRTEDGKVLYWHLRIQVSGKDKWRYRDKGDTPLVLYGLDQIPFGKDRGKIVVVEGESDQLTLAAHGIPSVGLPGAPQTATITKNQFEGIDRVYVVQELDEAGAKVPAAVARRLADLGLPAVVLVVKLDAKDTNELYKQDPSRFEKRFKRACLDARGLRLSKVKLHYATDIIKTHFPPMRWVVPGLVPEGLTVLFSAPKVGKSYLAVQIAAAVAQGKDLFSGWRPEKGKVLLIDLEQPVGVQMQGRLRLHGASRDNYQTQIADEWPEIGKGCLDEMDIYLEENPECRLVIVDVWANIKPRATGGGNAYDEEYRTIKALRGLFLRRHAGCIVIHHDKKGGEGGITEKASGTKALVGGANALLWLQRPTGENRATLTVSGREVQEAELHAEFNDRKWQVWPPGDE